MNAISDSTSKPNTWGRALAIIGIVLQFAPMVGMLGTVGAMVQSFETMGSSGIGDPPELALSIGHALNSVFAGLTVGLIGQALLVLSLTVCRYRATWFFWFNCIYGGICVVLMPIWIVYGVFVLVYTLSRKAEFFPREATELATS